MEPQAAGPISCAPAKPGLARSAASAIRAFAWLALSVVIGVWSTARIANDRWLWSQYVFWIPEELQVLAAVTLLLVCRPARRRVARPGAGSRPARFRAAVVAVGIMTIHLVFVHWRALNALSRPARGATAGAFRIAHWNVTAIEGGGAITATLFPLRPDVVVLVNPHSRAGWPEVIRQFGTPVGLIWEKNFVVLSRLHIVRHGSLELGLGSVGRRDPGRALFFELDTTAKLGRTTVVWAVDLPSDFRLSRRSIAAGAAAAIGAWGGPQMVHDTVGGTVPSPAGPGFPRPDIVVGDFNAPRGSASLGLLSPGMADAFTQGGLGYTASWPGYGYRTPVPVVHIDQTFVGKGLRAARYETLKPVFGYHWPQWAEIVTEDVTGRARDSR